jgi:hypothetical protein
VGAVVVALGVTGCSSSSDEQKRDYAVPAKVCAVPMPASALKPLLPGGAKLTSRPKDLQGMHTCELIVDDARAVSTIVERWERGTTVLKVMTAADLGDEKAPTGDEPVVSDSVGLARVTCSPAAPDGQEVFATIRAHNAPGRAAMRKAVTAYAAKAGTTANCRS